MNKGLHLKLVISLFCLLMTPMLVFAVEPCFDKDLEDKVLRFKDCKKRTEQGDIEAQGKLASMYYRGYGTDKNYNEAFKWATDDGHETWQARLGEMYQNGLGVEKDYAEAGKWYKKAIDNGNKTSQFTLAKMYLSGQLEKNVGEALDLIEQAVELNNNEAQFYLGGLYHKGEIVPKNLVLAYHYYYLSKLAEWCHFGCDDVHYSDSARERVSQDMTHSQIREAKRLTYEWLAHRNMGFVMWSNDADHLVVAAVTYLKEGKEKCRYATLMAENAINYSKNMLNSEATLLLANIYRLGQCVEKNHVEAFRWYKKAAEQGEIRAQYQLAKIYLNGVGTEKDETMAFFLFDLLSNEGSPYRGEASAKRNHLALKLSPFQRQKARDYDFAFETKVAGTIVEHRLAQVYEKGLANVEVDEVKAGYWYQQTLNIYKNEVKNYSYGALYSIAMMYLKGEGLPQDYTMAYLLLELLTKKIVPNDYFDTTAIMKDISDNLAEKYQVMEAEQLATEIMIASDLAKELDNIVPNSEDFTTKRLEIRSQVKKEIKERAESNCMVKSNTEKAAELLKAIEQKE